MNTTLVAFDSLGIRSQATFVQSRDANIFIDPSAAIAPRRFGLPPHLAEAKKLLEAFNKIEELLRDSDVLIFTHYHYDHHDPGRFIDPSLYRGKVVYVKDPQRHINASQRSRALKFLKTLNGKAKVIHVADRNSKVLGRTVIRFSDPLPHGESDRLGYVVSVCIDDGETSVLYTSDIEGGPRDEHQKLLNLCEAKIAIVDGPPTYLLGYKYDELSLKSSIAFISSLISLNHIELVVLDHHLCRDLDYRSKVSQIFDRARSLGKSVKTAAETMGLSPLLLEALRRNLYKESPESGLGVLKSHYRTLEAKGDPWPLHDDA